MNFADVHFKNNYQRNFPMMCVLFENISFATPFQGSVKHVYYFGSIHVFKTRLQMIVSKIIQDCTNI